MWSMVRSRSGQHLSNHRHRHRHRHRPLDPDRWRWAMELKDLPLIEQGAIKMLLEGSGVAQATLCHQLEAVKAVQRSESSAGVYAIFELDEGVSELEGKPSFHLADVFAKSGK